MKCGIRLLKSSLFLGLVVALLPVSALGQRYKETDLVSDIMGRALVHDPNLKNPWGLTRSSGSPWWVANNNSGTSTLYDGNGNPFPPPSNGGPLVVTVPPPGFAPGTQGAPTGIVFNGSPTDFLLAPGKQAIFIFATEDGTISGWNPGVNPPTSVTNAILKVDNCDKGSNH